MPLIFDATRSGLERLAPGFDLSSLNSLDANQLLGTLQLALGLLGGSINSTSVSPTLIVSGDDASRVELTGSGFSPVTSPQAFDDAFSDQTASGTLTGARLFNNDVEVAALTIDDTGWSLVAGALEVQLNGDLPDTLSGIYALSDLLFGALGGGLTPAALAALVAPLAGNTLDSISVSIDGTEVLSETATADGLELAFAGYTLDISGSLPDPSNDLSQVLLFLGSALTGDTSIYSVDLLTLRAPGGEEIATIASTGNLIQEALVALLSSDIVTSLLVGASYTIDGTVFDAVQLDVPLDGLPGVGTLLDGTALADALFGYGGADTLMAGAGSDLVSGGDGNDSFNGGIGFDTMTGGAGNDTLLGLDGFDSLMGDAGDDSLQGNFGNDTVDGGDGDDTVEGGLGFDSLMGGAGNDFLQARNGFDTVEGGEGNDTLEGNNGNDSLDGGAGNDSIEGGLGADTLNGNDGNDRMFGLDGFDLLDGGAGNDVVQGNAGNDTMNGGAGDDTMRGGLGADTFVFTGGADQINDFQPVDGLQIEADLLTEASPVAEDLRSYAGRDADGNLVFDFGDGNTLTFLNVDNATLVLDDVTFI